MTDTTGLCVDSCIDALPGWQRGFCREVLQLVRAAGSQVTETIMRINRPWFVLEGAFLCHGHRPGPGGIIAGGHAGKTGRAVAIRYGGAVTAPALIALLRQVIASDRVGGWRELSGVQMGPGLDVGLSGIPGR
jgi:hypothetical protein